MKCVIISNYKINDIQKMKIIFFIYIYFFKLLKYLLFFIQLGTLCLNNNNKILKYISTQFYLCLNIFEHLTLFDYWTKFINFNIHTRHYKLNVIIGKLGKCSIDKHFMSLSLFCIFMGRKDGKNAVHLDLKRKVIPLTYMVLHQF